MSATEDDCEVVDSDGNEVEFRNGDVLTVKGGILDMGHAAIVRVRDGEITVLEVNLDETTDDPRDIHVQETGLCEFLERYEEAGRSVHRSRPKKPDGMDDAEWAETRAGAVSFVDDRVCTRYHIEDYLVNAVFDLPDVWFCSGIIDEAYGEHGVDVGDGGGGGIPNPICSDPLCTEVEVDYSNLEISDFSSSDMNPWGYVWSWGGVEDNAEAAADQEVREKVAEMEESLDERFGTDCDSDCGCLSKSYTTTLHWEQSVSTWESVLGDWVQISFELDVDIEITYRIGLCLDPDRTAEMVEEIRRLLGRLVEKLENGEVSIEDLADAVGKTTPKDLREGDAFEEPEEIRRRTEEEAESGTDAGDDESRAASRSAAPTGDRSLATVEGIGDEFAVRLAEHGVETLDDLAAVDPDALDVRGVSADRLAKWRSNAALLDGMTDLTGNDAEVLVTMGVTRPEDLAPLHPGELHERIHASAEEADVPADYSPERLLELLGVEV